MEMNNNQVVEFEEPSLLSIVKNDDDSSCTTLTFDGKEMLSNSATTNITSPDDANKKDDNNNYGDEGFETSGKQNQPKKIQEKPDFWKMVSQRFEPPKQEKQQMKKDEDKMGMFFKDLSKRFNANKEKNDALLAPEAEPKEEKGHSNEMEPDNIKKEEEKQKDKPKDIWKMLAKAITDPDNKKEGQPIKENNIKKQISNNHHESEIATDELKQHLQKNPPSIEAEYANLTTKQQQEDKLTDNENTSKDETQDKQVKNDPNNLWKMLSKAISSPDLSKKQQGPFEKKSITESTIETYPSSTDDQNEDKVSTELYQEIDSQKKENVKLVDQIDHLVDRSIEIEEEPEDDELNRDQSADSKLEKYSMIKKEEFNSLRQSNEIMDQEMPPSLSDCSDVDLDIAVYYYQNESNNNLEDKLAITEKHQNSKNASHKSISSHSTQSAHYSFNDKNDDDFSTSIKKIIQEADELQDDMRNDASEDDSIVINDWKSKETSCTSACKRESCMKITLNFSSDHGIENDKHYNTSKDDRESSVTFPSTQAASEISLPLSNDSSKSDKKSSIIPSTLLDCKIAPPPSPLPFDERDGDNRPLNLEDQPVQETSISPINDSDSSNAVGNKVDRMEKITRINASTDDKLISPAVEEECNISLISLSSVSAAPPRFTMCMFCKSIFPKFYGLQTAPSYS